MITGGRGSRKKHRRPPKRLEEGIEPGKATHDPGGRPRRQTVDNGEVPEYPAYPCHGRGAG
jgi:hypothetical protein